MELLRRAGLWDEAELYREDVRQRLRTEGTSKQEAVAAAWREMADHFEPIARKIEALQREQARFVGYAGDVDEITDPDYLQPDAGKRFRDAFVWVGDEFRRITTDSPTGTQMDFSRARTRPPSPLAIQIAEHYAIQPPGKRTELLARLAGFATKTHAADDATNADPDEDGFLHEIDGWRDG